MGFLSFVGDMLGGMFKRTSASDIISAISPLVGGTVQRNLDQVQQDRANAFNAEMMYQANAFSASQVDQQRAWDAFMVDRMNAYNSPAAVRQRAEDAGFNPLLFMAPGVGAQTGSPSSGLAASAGAGFSPVSATPVSQQVADAAAFVGSQISQSEVERAARLNSALNDNARLRDQLLRSSLRPDTGGIFARSSLLPSMASAVSSRKNGGGNAVSSGVASGSGVALGALDKFRLESLASAAAGRKINVAPVPSEAGFGIVDNAVTGQWWFPSVNGEVPELNQLPALGFGFGASLYERSEADRRASAASAAKSAAAGREVRRRLDAEKADRRERLRSPRFADVIGESSWSFVPHAGYNRDMMGRAPMDTLLTRRGSRSVKGVGPVRSW